MSSGAVLRRSDGTGAASAPDTMGFVGMIFGILSIGVAFIPSEMSWGAIVLSLLAIICSWTSFSRINRGLAGGRGMAITGFVTGILGVLLFFIAVTSLFTLFRDEIRP